VLDPDEFIVADDAPRIRGHANAYVAGDASHLPGTEPPKSWGMARQQAATVAANITALLVSRVRDSLWK
jgi:NADH dehydrogenase FAD-containing subunit